MTGMLYALIVINMRTLIERKSSTKFENLAENLSLVWLMQIFTHNITKSLINVAPCEKS